MERKKTDVYFNLHKSIDIIFIPYVTILVQKNFQYLHWLKNNQKSYSRI